MIKSWPQFYKQNDDVISSILQVVNVRRRNKKVIPNSCEVFKAFHMTQLSSVKVVILGQDPYSTPGDANGLAFSVSRDHNLPKSLVNIFQEIQDDVGITNTNGDLVCWARQGVLLLNSVLTVDQYSPNSHKLWGWKSITNKALSILSKKGGVVFMLWGREAQNSIDYIEKENNLILTAPHPSPLSANKGFFGCQHFSKTNEFLKETNQTLINWSTTNLDTT